MLAMVDQRSIVWSLLLLWAVVLFEPTFQQQPSQQPLSSFTERVALLQLRSSLGLRSKDWPIKQDPCSIWKGVDCSDGRVVGINISGFRRTRLGSQNPQFSVDSLANLTLLSSFNASNFLLPGSIPDWFGQSLGSLQVLDLTSCSINGPIPITLGNSTNLTSLSLSHNNHTGIIPASLGNLVRLSVLDLSWNRLTGSIPTSFGSLDNLSVLDMSGNFLSGSIPLGIGNLLKLQSLNLSSNMLSSSIPSQLGAIGRLVDLDLSSNQLVGPLPPGLKGLTNLQRMIIAKNLLSGVPDALWSMPKLSFLDLSGNNFTGLLPNSSSSANATLSVFNISQNLFYGSLTPFVGRFGVIDLSGNYFEGEIPIYVDNNASLDSNCLRNLTNQRTLSECSAFYADKGLVFDNFGQPNSTQPPAVAPPGKKKSNKNVIILAAVLGGVGLIALLILCVVVFLLCSRKRGTTTQREIGVGPVPSGSSPPPAAAPAKFDSIGDAFTYQQLLQATGDFNNTNLMKNGHTGDLFRGVLENGIPVVIKRIDLRCIKKEAHVLELDFFCKFSHPRFVPFLGHCLENENEKFMVYKYMPNVDLSSSLYKKTNTMDGTLQSLDWITRLKIALGAAEGLTYLHHECNPPIVHRDVQASSILLDDKFEVRLGSLSDICAQEGDTQQSRITRLLRLPQSSEQGASGSSTALCAYDVYCFGKVLLELVTGKLGISASSESQLKESLEQILPYISIYDKELVTKIVDPSLIVDEDLLEEVWAMAVVARSCLNPKPSRRPLMRYILKALENPVKVVREDSTGSARLRTTSSRGSWNATVFGSWRSTSDVAVIPGASGTKGEGASGLKHSSGSQGSGPNGGGEHSSSRRRHSRDIFPEPSGSQDVERSDQD